MKFVLCINNNSVNEEKNHAFWKDVDDSFEYFLDLPSSSVILPIGTIIEVIDGEKDKATGGHANVFMRFEVVGYQYFNYSDTLCINVDIHDGDMTSQEFSDYLGRCWRVNL
ncbi:MAG: hypothetical protein US30_C0001G0113 [Candidatus Moranbacteria bacterium GW2011_GWF2_36_839]|nr:MAG: hypothetical protein US27_C0001G0113 [Candidatus Moranbacteria bacterium GW2011_GWF1_36_78]KKQ17779.1 MAG: hypothetical protein US30_C0001G0113 [Candidatus Moranbacteria bacterium GW2011_GWF2_36_839]HAT73481.1 hypothetical protein [Candidatus Moranbacteria bacterium]HBY10843.1 hypothetical protein [Candidatus Moranbacteria bacterium]